jgi:hypothetical protein
MVPMALELRDIPTAPRCVRWHAVVWRAFGACLAGAVLLVYGGVLTLLLWISDRGSYYTEADRSLDRERVIHVGRVTEVDARSSWRGDAMDLVRFRFTADDGIAQEGASFFAPGVHGVGEEVEVEYSPRTGDSRVLGGSLVQPMEATETAFWATVVPGAALLLLWVAAVRRLRRVLRNGDVTIAEPVEVRRVPFMVPTMLEVRFRFRDRSARVREGHHWVRARSELGERLSTAAVRPSSEPRVLWTPKRGLAPVVPTDWQTVRSTDLPRLCVIHDRTRPQANRLVAASDFSPASPTSPALPPHAWLG